MFVELEEYGKSEEWRWGAQLLDTLRAESEDWKVRLGLPFQPVSIAVPLAGRYTIRAQGVAGFLRVGELSIDIRPKFLGSNPSVGWRKALWNILAAVDDHPAIGSPFQAEVAREESFADLLGWTFLRSISATGLEGFPRGYQETSESLPMLRGRLDYGKVTDLLGRPYLLPCIFDEYTEDILMNRLLRWAASTLVGMVQSAALASRLGEVADSLANVSRTVPGLVEVEHIALPVQYDFLSPALHVSKLLMRGQSLHHYQGQSAVPSFLWHSSDVFERFVRRLLSQICDEQATWTLRKSAQTLAQPSPPSATSAKPINTIPDYRVESGGKTLLLLDAKYKTWSISEGPSARDVYQVLAGARVNRCECACLVYPAPKKQRRAPILWRVRASGYPTHVACVFIDLTAMGDRQGEELLRRDLREDVLTVIASTSQ